MDKNNENIVFDKQAEEVLSILNLDVTIPDGLIEKVIQKTKKIQNPKPVRYDFIKYFQIAAVFAIAVFVGILMGQNADISLFNKKNNKEKQALIELREKHHLSEKESFGRLW